MKFWKMNGAGNDFIIINNIKENIPNKFFPLIASTLCERHLSLGADGLIIIDKPQADGDFMMLFYNSDGSLGEMCGNGARCICRYGYENGLASEIQHIETTAGIITGYRINSVDYRIRLNNPSKIINDFLLNVDGITYECSYIELGNPGIPHAIVPIKNLRNIPDSELYILGKKIRNHVSFDKGANVNFYEIINKNNIYIKTYERGVEGFTYACGTGTGSTVLSLWLKGITESTVIAHMRGGILKIQIDGNTNIINNLWLEGPTNVIAMGELTDHNLINIIRGEL